jgi:hypothetical protein
MSHSKDNKEQSNRQDDDPETKSMIWERINAYTTAHDTAIRVMEQNHHGQALEITPPVTDLAVSPQDPALADSPSDNVIHLGERLVRAAAHGIAGQLEYINWLHDEQLRNGTDG